MALAAKRLARAPRRALSKEQILRLVRFPAIRRAISGGLARQMPLSVDIPKGGRYVRFRLADPRRFHPSLFATMDLGGRGTKGVIGTPLSSVHKKAELASFLRRLGARLKGAGRRGMIYQLRGAGIIGPSALQSVLVPISRVQQVVARFAASPRLRRVVGNPILATLGFNPSLQVGDTVKVKREFLRSIGAFTGPMGHARGRITSLHSMGGLVLAAVKWDRSGVSEKMNVANLAPAGKREAENPRKTHRPNPRSRQMMPRRVPKGRANEIAAALRKRGYTALTYAAYPGKVWSTAPKALVKAVVRHNGPVLPTAAFNRKRHARKNPKLSFEEWMSQVDRAVQQRVGLSVHDLADAPFRDWYEDGIPPRSAASRAIRSSDENPARRARVKTKRKSCNNPRHRRAARNHGTQEIRIPFRDGQKITPAQMRAWLRSLPEGAVKRNIVRRFEQGLKQYKSFHLGAEPKSFTYRAVQMGSAGKQITDVDVVVSEGKEWAATYQVPRHSRKYHGGGSDGRYIHAHGESDMDVDIKRVASKRLLPERFHTADGKFVGVVPTRNVKITDWYRG